LRQSFSGRTPDSKSGNVGSIPTWRAEVFFMSLVGFQIKVRSGALSGVQVTCVAEHEVMGKGYQGEARYRDGTDLLAVIAEAVHDAGKAPILTRPPVAG
jgi:hypothetical protein